MDRSTSLWKSEEITSWKALSGVFVRDQEAIPPGITNIAMNCYANSVFQCLLNHNGFIALVKDIIEEHERVKCNYCRQMQGILYKYLIKKENYYLKKYRFPVRSSGT